jgi:hypothetical protein
MRARGASRCGAVERGGTARCGCGGARRSGAAGRGGSRATCGAAGPMARRGAAHCDMAQFRWGRAGRASVQSGVVQRTDAAQCRCLGAAGSTVDAEQRRCGAVRCGAAGGRRAARRGASWLRLVQGRVAVRAGSGVFAGAARMADVVRRVGVRVRTVACSESCCSERLQSQSNEAASSASQSMK